MKPAEQAVESDEAGLEREDAVELCRERGLALRGWTLAIGFEIAVERPDRGAHGGLGGAVLRREGVELVNQAFGMDPAQGMPADIELAGVVADDDALAQETVGLDAAPQRALGGDQHRVGIDLEGRDPELLKVCVPGRLIGEAAVAMW